MVGPDIPYQFGVFSRTADVDSIAARVDYLIIRPGGTLRPPTNSADRTLLPLRHKA